MKLFKIIIGIFVLTFLSLYVLVFTSFGHGIIVPILESQIKDATKLQNVKVEKFDLGINNLNTTILLEKQPMSIDAKFDILSQDIDVDYSLHIKDLTKFQNLTKQKIKGEFSSKAKITGKLDDMLIKGNALVAKGNIKYDLKIKENQPKDINFSISNLQLEALLDMLYQPAYTKGSFSTVGKISSVEPLNALVKTTITNGYLNHKTIKEKFDITLPKNPTYDLTVNTKLDKKLMVSDTTLDSFAAKLTTAKTQFNLENQKLTTDYTLLVPSLAKLYFITNQKMRGDIKVTGDVTFDKKILATFNSNKFDGIIAGKLDDTKLTVNTKDIKTLNLLHMMYYPEIFKSKLKLDLDYDLKTKKGLAKFDMGNGRFLVTEAIKMINSILKKDISLEVYKKALITTNINDTILNNDIYFQSKNIHITSNKAIVDTKNQTVDSDIKIKYKKYDLALKATGDIKDPKVKIDAKEALKQKAKEKVVEKLEEKIEEKLGGNIKGLLKGLFK